MDESHQADWKHAFWISFLGNPIGKGQGWLDIDADGMIAEFAINLTQGKAAALVNAFNDAKEKLEMFDQSEPQFSAIGTAAETVLRESHLDDVDGKLKGRLKLSNEVTLALLPSVDILGERLVNMGM